MKYDRITPKKRVVVVTGGARGIGWNIARAFGKLGMTVIIGDIDKERGEAAEKGFRKEGLKIFYQEVDLAKKGGPQVFIREIAERWGRVDVLVNNVRGGRKVMFETEDEENWDATMEVMVRSSFFASREAMEVMRKQGGGSIVNIASILNKLTIAGSPAYQVAKAGLTQMTRYLAQQGGKEGIRVNTVSPGFVIQDEHRARFEGKDNEAYKALALESVLTADVGSSDDIAQMVVFLADPKNKFVTAQEFIVDGGSSVREHFDKLMEAAPPQPTEKSHEAA